MDKNKQVSLKTWHMGSFGLPVGPPAVFVPQPAVAVFFDALYVTGHVAVKAYDRH